MKNLKRVLALTLVVAMMFTFAISAGAASTKTYSDQDQITHADAAAVLTELGVIKGYEDGSFKPTANVTRAEMAKMITVILNKGVDNQSMFTDGTTDLTDINWHWAKGYITYCYTLGIIAGDGAPNNTFRPDDPVTGTEAAKMLLVALGADVTQEGLVGTNWDVKANGLANSTGLFDDTTDAVNVAASRDFVVQMVYNMLNANTIQYDVNYFTGISTKLTDTELAITKYFGAKRYVGIVTANEFANLNGGDALSAGKTTVAVKEVNGLTTVSSTSTTTVVKDQSFNVSTDEGYLGRKVNLFYNETSKKVIGNPVIKSTDNVVVEVGAGPPLADAVKAAGLKLVQAYNFASAATTDYTQSTVTTGMYYKSKDVEGTEYYLNYSNFTDCRAIEVGPDGTAFAEIKDTVGYTVVAISNTDSNTVNYVFFVAPVMTEVTKVEAKGGGNEYTIKGVNLKSDGTEDKVKSDDMVTSITSIAKGDYVLVTEIGGIFYVDAPETFKGKVTSRTAGEKASVTIGGDKYDMSDIQCLIEDDDVVAKVYMEDWISGPGSGTFDTRFKALNFTTEYTYYKDTLGNVAAIISTDGSSKYALVTGVSTVGGYSDAWQARLLFADGTTASHEIKSFANQQTAYSTLKDAGVGSAVKVPVPVTYSMNGSKVDLTEVTTGLTLGTEGYTAAVTAASPTITKEKAQLGSTGLYANSNTVYYYAVTDGSDMKYYTFTGYMNAPTVNNGSGQTRVWAVQGKTSGVAAAVYVWTAKADYVGTASKDYVFIYGDFTKNNNDTVQYECTYVMANGEVKEEQSIIVDDTYPNGVYEYTLKSEGVYELGTALPVETLASASKTLVTWADTSYLDRYANVTSKTTITQIGGNGKPESVDRDDLAQYMNVVAVKIKDSDEASFIWVAGSTTAVSVAQTAAKARVNGLLTGLTETDYTAASWLALKNAIATDILNIDNETTVSALSTTYYPSAAATTAATVGVGGLVVSALKTAKTAVETITTTTPVTVPYKTNALTTIADAVTALDVDTAIASKLASIDATASLAVWTNKLTSVTGPMDLVANFTVLITDNNDLSATTTATITIPLKITTLAGTAKTAIDAATFTSVSETYATSSTVTTGAVIGEINTRISSLSLTSVTATVTWVGEPTVVSGSAADSSGTYTFNVSIVGTGANDTLTETTTISVPVVFAD